MELYFGYVILPKTKITQWKYNFIVFLNPKYNGIVLLLYIKKNQKKKCKGKGKGKEWWEEWGKGKEWWEKCGKLLYTYYFLKNGSENRNFLWGNLKIPWTLFYFHFKLIITWRNKTKNKRKDYHLSIHKLSLSYHFKFLVFIFIQLWW